MTQGSHGPRRDRSHRECDSARALGLVLAGAGGSGLVALATLASGGGILAAFLVYVLGSSMVVPVLAAAPYARQIVARARVGGPRLARQPS
jgi:hypothetical protein